MPLLIPISRCSGEASLCSTMAEMVAVASLDAAVAGRFVHRRGQRCGGAGFDVPVDERLQRRRRQKWSIARQEHDGSIRALQRLFSLEESMARAELGLLPRKLQIRPASAASTASACGPRR